MISIEKRPIALTNDLDGVHTKAPIPLTSFRKLLMRGYKLSAETFEITPYTPPTNLVERWVEKVTAFTHRNRAVNPEGIVGLQMLRETACSHHRKMTIMALSGRIKPVHEATHQDLGTMYDEYFERWLLNEGTHAAEWKEYQARELTREGFTVVHLEDDLNPALRMARVENVFVYLFRNLSNHPKLLHWAGIELPENVVSVKGFEVANTDFNRRLHLGLT